MWRVAGSLLTLRDQIDQLYPGRSRVSDGTIGDAAHQLEQSDHNPDRYGVVRALDITNDPQHGCDIGLLSDMLAETRDDRISYVIANRLIMSGWSGPSPWVWRHYSGSDPHTGHLHLSVVQDDRADDRRPWQLRRMTVAITTKGPTMIIAACQGTYVVTDWNSWHDRTLDYERITDANRAGIPLVQVTDAEMQAILALPAPRTGAGRPILDVTAAELAAALLDEIAARR
jgi:hypothetical protein